MDEKIKEWLRNGITGDDVAVLMGHVDDRTPLDVYKEKLSPFPPKKSYFEEISEKAEPRIRSLIMAQLGIDFIPLVDDMRGHTYVRSYVAGKAGADILVIKLISRSSFNYFKESGMLMDKHYVSVQHDIMVHGATRCYFVGYLFDKATKAIDTKNMFITQIEKDRPTLIESWDSILKFQQQRQLKIPPQMTGVDRVELSERLKEYVSDPDNDAESDKMSMAIRDLAWRFMGGDL